MHTVIGAFDDRTQAQRALDRLVQSGIDPGNVHIEQQEPQAGGAPQREAKVEDQGSRRGFFASLFGMEDQANTGHAHTYDEAVRRGSSVVVVDAQDEAQAELACGLLHEAGAVDVDERAQQWQASGWQPPGQQQADSGATGQGMPARPVQQQGDVTAAGTGQGMLRDDAPPVGQEGVLDVVQEEMNIGKRRLDKGGVRVVQRVSQKPVREVLRLHEEQAKVERRPVDRPATGAELGTFKEGTLEVREMTEEPVVSKTARVVEEVRVGKDVREREETIEDSVRRKDVDVERLEGSRGSTRERAVAADQQDRPLAERDVPQPSGKPRRNP